MAGQESENPGRLHGRRSTALAYGDEGYISALYQPAQASQRRMVILSKIVVLVLGVVAFVLAMYLTSVLDMAFFAYTIYGVAITPALIGAFLWKRANTAGGLTSIISGTVVALLLKNLGEPYGIPLIFPALAVSVGSFILVSLLTSPPKPEQLKPFVE